MLSGDNSAMLVVLLLATFGLVVGHEGHGHESPACKATNNPLWLSAPFAPGVITVDGQDFDWDSVSGEEAPLQQALGEAAGQPVEYPQGSGQVVVKAAHDGKNLYLLVKAPGPYIYTPGDHHMSVSAALMFAIGEDATSYNMGGCPQAGGQCSPETCRDHEVDLIHFEVDAAIPGRQYGRNLLDLLIGTGTDRIGNLSDGYGYNPHCKYPDHTPDYTGLSPSGSVENDWVGSWSHSSLSTKIGLVTRDSPYGTHGEPGHFIFEFSRPLRTNDHFQQDVQFTIGAEHKIGVAIWYPLDKQPWQDHQHYILSCDWAILSLSPNPTPMFGWSYSSGSQSISATAATALSAMAMALSVAAVFVSIVVGYWVKANHRHFDSVHPL